MNGKRFNSYLISIIEEAMNNNQDNSKNKSQPFQVGLMKLDSKDIVPLEAISNGIININIDNALDFGKKDKVVEIFY